MRVPALGWALGWARSRLLAEDPSMWGQSYVRNESRRKKGVVEDLT